MPVEDIAIEDIHHTIDEGDARDEVEHTGAKGNLGKLFAAELRTETDDEGSDEGREDYRPDSDRRDGDSAPDAGGSRRRYRGRRRAPTSDRHRRAGRRPCLPG